MNCWLVGVLSDLTMFIQLQDGHLACKNLIQLPTKSLALASKNPTQLSSKVLFLLMEQLQKIIMINIYWLG